MNAISPHPTETPAAQAARHRHACQRITELAMQLLELAAKRALQEPPPQTPTPIRRAADPNLLFIRLSIIVRQAIALENKIAVAPKSSDADLVTKLCRDLTQELTQSPPPTARQEALLFEKRSKNFFSVGTHPNR